MNFYETLCGFGAPSHMTKTLVMQISRKQYKCVGSRQIYSTTRNCIDLYEYFRIYYKFKDMLYPQKDVKIQYDLVQRQINIILADIWLNNPTGNSELTGKRNLRFRNWMILKGMHILPYLKMVKIGGNYDGKFPCSFQRYANAAYICT